MARALRLAILLCFFFSGALAHQPKCEELAQRVGLIESRSETVFNWIGKTVLLDTNILLKDPLAFLKFPGAHIIMTGTVFEEIDSKKSHPRLGVAARHFSREFLKFFDGAESAADVRIDDQGTRMSFDLKSYSNRLEDTSLRPDLPDNQILAAALAYTGDHKRENVILVTDDNNMRMKSIGLGIQSRPFEREVADVEVDAEAEDLTEVEISDDEMNLFLQNKSLPLPKGLNLAPNEFVRFKSPSVEAADVTVARYHYNRERPERSAMKPLPEFARMGLIALPRNIEQAMALDVLLDTNVDCVILEAKAGTGKTFLALLAADYFMKKVRNYGRVNLSKPTAYVGENDPGALPGNIEEKYQEWMKSYLDNFSKLKHLETRGGKSNPKSPNPNYAELVRSLPNGYELLPFEFLRGRTLDDSFNVLDEGQNTKPVHIKTFLTRAGDRAKMVLMGDTSQLDLSEHQANETNNGLSYAIRNLLSPEIPLDQRSRVARVKLFKGERSPFADMAADRL